MLQKVFQDLILWPSIEKMTQEHFSRDLVQTNTPTSESPLETRRKSTFFGEIGQKVPSKVCQIDHVTVSVPKWAAPIPQNIAQG